MGIDQWDDRNGETLGLAHQAASFAEAVGMRHPIIVVLFILHGAPLLVADKHQRFAVHSSQTAQNGVIVAEIAITTEFKEIIAYLVHIVDGVGAIFVAGAP